MKYLTRVCLKNFIILSMLMSILNNNFISFYKKMDSANSNSPRFGIL